MFTPNDYNYMSQALGLAKQGIYTTHPNPRVGCVIVKDGIIVGEGFHARAGEPHAEVHALRMAGEKAKGATAYVTLEPCSHTGRTPPCATALIKAGVKRVIAAMQDPNPLVAGSGLAMLKAAGIETANGLLEIEARKLNAGFIKRMEHGLPWVRVKLAMSLDGRTAMQSGESMWITGDAARRDVQFLRAKASAILTGSGTVLMDNPSLNVRLSSTDLAIQGDIRQAIRIIIDSQLKTPSTAKLFDLSGDIWIFTSEQHDKEKAQALISKGAKLFPMAMQQKHLSLTAIMQELAKQQINEIHVEAGATLCGALLQENLVDEMIIYMAPHIMGCNTRGLFSLPHLQQMKDRIDIRIDDIRAIGNDWRITAKPNYNLNP